MTAAGVMRVTWLLAVVLLQFKAWYSVYTAFHHCMYSTLPQRHTAFFLSIFSHLFFSIFCAAYEAATVTKMFVSGIQSYLQYGKHMHRSQAASNTIPWHRTAQAADTSKVPLHDSNI